MTEPFIVGTPVPWWQRNGWIMQANQEPHLTRWCLYVMGVRVTRTPWLYTGPINKETA